MDRARCASIFCCPRRELVFLRDFLCLSEDERNPACFTALSLELFRDTAIVGAHNNASTHPPLTTVRESEVPTCKAAPPNDLPAEAGSTMIPDSGTAAPVSAGPGNTLRKCTGQKDSATLASGATLPNQEHHILPTFQRRDRTVKFIFIVHRLLIPIAYQSEQNLAAWFTACNVRYQLVPVLHVLAID